MNMSFPKVDSIFSLKYICMCCFWS